MRDDGYRFQLLETLERRMMLDASVELIADVNRTPAVGVDHDHAWLGDLLLFAADDGAGDVELWKTDGTAEGTTRVRDIRDGGSSFPQQFVSANDVVYFTAYAEETGRELWKTDGTTEGTMLVADVHPGPTDSQSPGQYPPPTLVNGLLFFTADDGVSGTELWRSDGTTAGTFMLRDIYPGAADSWPGEFIEFQDRLYFAAENADFGRELWSTDGTQEGTVLVADFAPGGQRANPSSFFEHGGSLYFASNPPAIRRFDGDTMTTLADQFSPNWLTVGDDLWFSAGPWNARTLWRTDGTPEGTLSLPANNLPTGYISQMVSANGVAYLVYDEQPFVESPYQLWRTDGTTEGTFRLTSTLWPNQQLHSLTVAGDSVYFVIFESFALGTAKPSRSQLWRTNGTIDGTVGVVGLYDVQIIPSTASDRVYVIADSDGTGREVFLVDSEDGSVTPLEIVPGNMGSVPGILAQKDDRLYLWSGVAGGLWIYESDGTQPQTLQGEISGRTEPALRTFPSGTRFVSVDDYVLFSANDADDDVTIVNVNDGLRRSMYRVHKATKTVERIDSIPIHASNRETLLTGVGDAAYFVLDVNGNPQLWRTDGTNDGSSHVPIDAAFTHVAALQSANDLLFFLSLNDERYATELWRTDGTAAGTFVVKELQGSRREWEFGFVEWNGSLYFALGNELWRSDGSTAGTLRVATFEGERLDLTPALTQLYVVADLEFSDNAQLWVTSGTEASTTLVATVDGAQSRLFAPDTYDDSLVFSATPPAAAEGHAVIWITDGTSEGTRVLVDVELPEPVYPYYTRGSVHAVEDQVFFTTQIDSDRWWLWSSDGTTENTVNLQTVTGCDGIDSIELWPISAGGKLYFNNSTAEGGCELWSSDGTIEGTLQVADIAPGSGQARTKYHAEIDGHLYFAADDGFHGMELYRLPLAETPEPIVGDSNGDGIFNSADLVMVFQRGEYEDAFANNSTFEDGDWNRDGEFDSADLVFAFQEGNYVAQARMLDPVDLVFFDDTEPGRLTKKNAAWPDLIDAELNVDDLLPS